MDSTTSSCCLPTHTSNKFSFIKAIDDYAESSSSLDEDESSESSSSSSGSSSSSSAKESNKDFLAYCEKAGLDPRIMAPYMIMKNAPALPNFSIPSPNVMKQHLDLEEASRIFKRIPVEIPTRHFAAYNLFVDRAKPSCLYRENRLFVPPYFFRFADTPRVPINASPHLGVVPYIFTQAPTSDTMPDFFRMIAFYKSHVVVCLTDPDPSLRMPLYWGSNFANTAILTIKKLSSDILCEDRDHQVVHSKLQVYIDATQVAWKLHHYWLSGWPDNKGASSTILRTLCTEVRRRVATLGGTLTIHCWAGIGRTGTFAAVLEGMDCIDRGKQVDIPRIVTKFRGSRGYMVLSSAQLACIHNTIHDHALKN